LSSNTKGIILAGGAGTRLHPMTKIMSKQLLPIYDRPMIYYPLSNLINCGIKEILIITTPEDQNSFIKLIGNGEQFDVKVEYEIQDKPEGIAQALIIAEHWLEGKNSILILGDNLFFGKNLQEVVLKAIEDNKGATIFAYQVNDPERFGVINFIGDKVDSIVEKPIEPKSNWVATGMYIFNEEASDLTKKLKKSDRDEYEITELNNIYLQNDKLNAVLLDDSFYWLDTGTPDSLLEASNRIKNLKDSNIIEDGELIK